MSNIYRHKYLQEGVFGGIALIFIFLMLLLTSNKEIFLFFKDSYQFLIFSQLKNVSYEVGSQSVNFFMPFYNRVGMAYVIAIFRQLGFSDAGELMNAIRYLNFLLLGLTGLTVFKILETGLNKGAVKKSVLGLVSAAAAGLFYSLNNINHFLAASVLNDTLAVFLLGIALFVLIKKQRFSSYHIVLFALISTLRVEYLLILLPIWMFYQASGLKLAYTLIGSFFVNAVLLLPFISNAWVDRQWEILVNLDNEIIFILLFGILVVIAIKYLKESIIQYLALIYTIIMSALLITSAVNIEFFKVVVFSAAIVIAVSIVSVISVYYNNQKLKWLELNKFEQFSALSIIVMLLFYKSFNYQHFPIIIFFAALFVFSYFVRLVNLRNFEKLNFKIKFLLAILFIIGIILIQHFIFIKTFQKIKSDPAQINANQANTFLNQQNIALNKTLIVTDYPEAQYIFNDSYAYDIESLGNIDAKESKKINQKYLLLVSYQPQQINIPGYTFLTRSNKNFEFDYNVQDQGVKGDLHTMYFTLYSH